MSVVDIVHASTWGAGHGTTRHLVDHGTYRVDPDLGPRSRCAGGRYRLDLLEADISGQDSAENAGATSVRQVVRAKRPCKSCAGFAHRFGVDAEEELLPFSRSDQRRTAIVDFLSGSAGAHSVRALCDWLRASGHREGWETLCHDLFILTGEGRVERNSKRIGALWQVVTEPAGMPHDQAVIGVAADTARIPWVAAPPAGRTS